MLDAQPTTTVTVALSSGDPTEVTVSPASLAFGPGNWSVPQTATVTGVDDFVMDGDQLATIVTAPAVSADPRYSGRDPADVQVLNRDDDVAEILVSATTPLQTTAAGGTATFTIRLRSQPTADVTIPLSSSDESTGTPSPASLTFVPAEWDVEQLVTVTGGTAVGPYTILTGAATSDDPLYSALDAADVSAENLP